MQINYSYDPVPTLWDFSQDRRFIRGVMGPFGSGKSSGCVWDIITKGIQQKPSADGISRTRWLVVRNTYIQLRDTTIRTFMDWIPPQKFGTYKQVDHEYKITALPNCEIEVLFRALDKPEHLGPLLSLEITGAWLNEAREIPESIMNMIQGRVGRFPSKRDGVGPTWSGLILDTNPPDTDSWWYRLFEEKRPENASLYKQPSGLSPEAENRVNLPDNYYENLAEGKDEEFVRVYVHGEYGYVMEGKPVYPEYEDSTHCRELEPVEGKAIRRGWDFGLTPSVSFSQMNALGQWLVLDEFIGDNIAADKFSDNVLDYCVQAYPGFMFEDYGDPAGDQRSQVDERTAFQVLRAKGIMIEPGDQDPGMRVECVKKALNTMIEGQPGMLIDPKAKTLRKGFRGGYKYRRIQTRNEQYSDKPEKNHYSHVHDALQYDATRLFGAYLRNPRYSAKPKSSSVKGSSWAA
jgi:hypothetical protein